MNAPRTPPLTQLDHMADWAFKAHTAMLRAERDDPALARNPYWQALRETANARFQLTYAAAAKQ